MNPSSAPAPPTERSRPPGLRRLFPPRRLALIVLVLLSLAHGLTYALIIPIWQAPDEPLLYEYAALLVRLGGSRVLCGGDLAPDVDGLRRVSPEIAGWCEREHVGYVGAHGPTSVEARR